MNFSVYDYFKQPAIFCKKDSGKNQLFHYDDNVIEFKYNQFGYRTHEFDQIPEKYILALGSSHTEGQGLHAEQIWTYHLETLLSMPVYVLAKGGSDSKFIARNIINWISKNNHLPNVIVIQWPPIYRCFVWNLGQGHCTTPTSTNNIYSSLLKGGNENFWVQWVENIINTNLFCQQHGIEVLNLYLENDTDYAKAESILTHYDIKLHVDEKLPGKTWLFDNQAFDHVHHSSQCHQQWADRIKNLIDHEQI
jgi:hypothetical protein